MTFLKLTTRILLFVLGAGLTPIHLEAGTIEENAERQRLNQLKCVDKPFTELSRQEVSDWGTLALRISEKDWKHAESEHFIVHYQVSDVKDRLIRDAEFYYWKLRRDFKATQELVNHKSHLFVFQDDARWRQFQANVDWPGIGGVCRGHEFFSYFPKQKTKEFTATLAHEMTHLVFHRFYPEHLALWLNEGLAEYQSRRAYRSLYDQGYETVGADFRTVSALNFLAMVEMSQYPASVKTRQAFYAKSHLTVELLAEKGGMDRLVEFINLTFQGSSFTDAFAKVYDTIFHGQENFLKELERKEKHLNTRR